MTITNSPPAPILDPTQDVKGTSRFKGLKLTDEDRSDLARRKTGGRKMSARTWRRIRVLELLDEGLSVRTTAKAVGGYPREISRVGKRYRDAKTIHVVLDNLSTHSEKSLVVAYSPRAPLP